MIKIKKIILRMILVIELIAIVSLYYTSTSSYINIGIRKNNKLKTDIEILITEIEDLERLILKYKEFDFYKEKIAREQLQLASAYDKIYFID